MQPSKLTKLCKGSDIKAAKPGEKLRFGSGLYLLVSPNGTKSWQVRFHDVAGHHQAKIVGRWPAIPVEEAEHRRDIIRHDKPRFDLRADRRRALADKALIEAFGRWKPTNRERRFLDESFMHAFASWRATR
jgi:hypothetical protein